MPAHYENKKKPFHPLWISCQIIALQVSFLIDCRRREGSGLKKGAGGPRGICPLADEALSPTRPSRRRGPLADEAVFHHTTTAPTRTGKTLPGRGDDAKTTRRQRRSEILQGAVTAAPDLLSFLGPVRTTMPWSCMRSPSALVRTASFVDILKVAVALGGLGQWRDPGGGRCVWVCVSSVRKRPTRPVVRPLVTCSLTDHENVPCLRRDSQHPSPLPPPLPLHPLFPSPQCFHYFTLILLHEIISPLSTLPLTLALIFNPALLNLSTLPGWFIFLTSLLGFVVNTVGLALIIEKSKKCLDFSITTFLLHFIFTVIYNGSFMTVVSSWQWWICQVSGMIIMVCLGEYVCSIRELREIPSLLG